jgi:hypothetical protein
MHLFSTELIVDDRMRKLRGDGSTLFGTTRIAAMIKRFEDEVVCAEGQAFTTGPVEQRREAA